MCTHTICRYNVSFLLLEEINYINQFTERKGSLFRGISLLLDTLVWVCGRLVWLHICAREKHLNCSLGSTKRISNSGPSVHSKT